MLQPCQPVPIFLIQPNTWMCAILHQADAAIKYIDSFFINKFVEVYGYGLCLRKRRDGNENQKFHRQPETKAQILHNQIERVSQILLELSAGNCFLLISDNLSIQFTSITATPKSSTTFPLIS